MNRFFLLMALSCWTAIPTSAMTAHDGKDEKLLVDTIVEFEPEAEFAIGPLSTRLFIASELRLELTDAKDDGKACAAAATPKEVSADERMIYGRDVEFERIERTDFNRWQLVNARRLREFESISVSFFVQQQADCRLRIYSVGEEATGGIAYLTGKSYSRRDYNGEWQTDGTASIRIVGPYAAGTLYHFLRGSRGTVDPLSAKGLYEEKIVRGAGFTCKTTEIFDAWTYECGFSVSRRGYLDEPVEFDDDYDRQLVSKSGRISVAKVARRAQVKITFDGGVAESLCALVNEGSLHDYDLPKPKPDKPVKFNVGGFQCTIAKKTKDDDDWLYSSSSLKVHATITLNRDGTLKGGVSL